MEQEQTEQRQSRELIHAEQSTGTPRPRLSGNVSPTTANALREVSKKKDVLRQRREDLDRRRDAIKRLREEVAAAQRETVEMRLATEELMARLGGTPPSAALTQSLAELRRKLADQHRHAFAELAERRSELAALAAKLGEERQKLTRQRGELQDWLNGREAELAEQAAALVAREQQLSLEEAAGQRRKLEHNEERRAISAKFANCSPSCGNATRTERPPGAGARLLKIGRQQPRHAIAQTHGQAMAVYLVQG